VKAGMLLAVVLLDEYPSGLVRPTISARSQQEGVRHDGLRKKGQGCRK